MDEFAQAVVEIKVKPLSEYCNIPISELECERSKVRCMLARAKEKLNQAKNCRGYNWQVKNKPKMVAFWTKVTGKLSEELQKMDDAMQERQAIVVSELDGVKQKFDSKFLKGWEPEGYGE